jgi:uncharacterized protein (DUF1501 family)
MQHPFGLLDRRGFLKSAGAAGAALALPITFAGAALPITFAGAARAATRPDRTLVLIHLAGGNDGLNTVIPYTDPAYAKLRPKIGIAADKVVQLSSTIGLHPALAPLATAWAAHDMAVVLGVGYPNPDFSHFRSGDIWQSGSGSDHVLSDGWAGRLLVNGGLAPQAVADTVIVTAGTGASFQAQGPTSVVMPSGSLSTGFIQRPVNSAPPTPASLAGVIAVDNEILTAAASFQNISKIVLPVTFPTTKIGTALAQAARIIMSGVNVPAIAALDGSYDTHTNQLADQNQRLTELGAAIAAFRDCLIKAGKWDRAMLMTFAEFGRRAAENGSGGTDHGTANAHFVLGGQVQGGFYGAYPSLTDLDNGNLKYTTDYRQLYSTIGTSWWGLPASAVAASFTSFPALPLIRSPAAT